MSSATVRPAPCPCLPCDPGGVTASVFCASAARAGRVRGADEPVADGAAGVGSGVRVGALEVADSAGRHEGRAESLTGRTAGLRGASVVSCDHARGSLTGENFSVRSVLGVASGPTPETGVAGSDGVGAVEVDGPGVDGAGVDTFDDDDGDEDDDVVNGRATVGSGRSDATGPRRRGSTLSEGTDGRGPTPSSPAGASPATA